MGSAGCVEKFLRAIYVLIYYYYISHEDTFGTYAPPNFLRGHQRRSPSPLLENFVA